MTKKGKTPQFSIRANKKDWERFQKISDREQKIYPVIFRDMLDAYESQKPIAKKASKSRRYVASSTPVKCPQTAQEAPQRTRKGGAMVSDGNTEKEA